MATNHGAIMRIIRAVEELQPTDYRMALTHLERFAEYWGGRWYLFLVTIGGREYYPVMSEAKAELVRGHAGWDLITTRVGKGVDE